MALIAHYEGDVTDQVVNRVIGPDTAYGYAVCESAVFDLATNRTTATFRPYLGELVEERGGEYFLASAEE